MAVGQNYPKMWVKLIFNFQFHPQFWVIFSTIVGKMNYWVVSLKSILPNMGEVKIMHQENGQNLHFF
jgi:hypothetical protein